MNLKELKIEFYKSTGPGGQHKNKRSTAVRITHLPSGIVVVGQEFRSQALNKKMALLRLERKLAARYRSRKRRVPTKIPEAVKERILEWKKKRGFKKRLRREKIDIEN